MEHRKFTKHEVRSIFIGIPLGEVTKEDRDKHGKKIKVEHQLDFLSYLQAYKDLGLIKE